MPQNIPLRFFEQKSLPQKQTFLLEKTLLIWTKRQSCLIINDMSEAEPRAESAKNYKLLQLTEEYSRLTSENQAAWRSFNPDVDDGYTVQLETLYKDYEAEEPLFAAMKRGELVKNIHPHLFPPQVLPGLGNIRIPDGSAIDFQFSYDEGDLLQLRTVEREDGTRISVLMVYEKTKRGYDPKEVEVLSHEGQDVAKRWYRERFLPGVKVSQQLVESVGISPEILEDVSLEDKQAMFATWQELNELPSVERERQINAAEFKTLTKARNEFVKAVLPGTRYLQNRREPHLAQLQVDYVSALDTLIAQGYPAEKLYLNERRLRLAALSKQMRVRARVDKIKQVGPPAVALPIVGVGGAAVSYLITEKPVVAAGVGLVSALVAAVMFRDESKSFNKRMKNISSFSFAAHESIPAKDLAAQFKQEREIVALKTKISSKWRY